MYKRQAKDGRVHILGEMNKALSASRSDVGKHTPKMEKINVDKKDIAAVIGKGGATIREIGHGKLAWRAIHSSLPSKEAFPYTFRVVSEITESNGSSSMATVCGASLALMDAGVPIKEPVAGIAMGLIKEGDDFSVLSDILGDEDH